MRTQGNASEGLLAILKNPTTTCAENLGTYVRCLLSVYAKFVQSQVKAIKSKRIEDEMAFLQDEPELQLEVLHSPVTGEPSVAFSLPLPVLHERLHQQSEGRNALHLQSRLHATFRAHSNMAPDLRLQIPDSDGNWRHTSASCPLWNSEQTLMQYRDVVDAHVVDVFFARTQPSHPERQPSEKLVANTPMNHSSAVRPLVVMYHVVLHMGRLRMHTAFTIEQGSSSWTRSFPITVFDI